jgi:hypothetical protein
VVRPDNVMRSWTWKKIRMRAGDIRSFVIPKEYEMKLAGTYRVDFNVYSRDMLPMYKRSKTFVAVDQRRSPAKASTPLPEEGRTRMESAPRQAAAHHAENPHFGVGLYADTVHSSGGATMFLWPSGTWGCRQRTQEGRLRSPKAGFSHGSRYHRESHPIWAWGS